MADWVELSELKWLNSIANKLNFNYKYAKPHPENFEIPLYT
jgi:hypothetical protein